MTEVAIRVTPQKPRWIERPPRKPGAVRRLRRDPLGLFQELRHEQGDVARIRFGGRNLVLLSHPDDIERVLVSEEPAFPRINVAYRSARAPRAPRPSAIVLGVGRDRDERVRYRRELAPAFARRRADVIVAGLAPLAAAGAAEWPGGEEIEVVPALQRLAVDVAVRAAFGTPLDAPLDDVLERARACMAPLVHASSPLYRAVERLKIARLLRAADAYEELLALMVRHIERAEPEGEGLFTLIARAGDAAGRSHDQQALEAFSILLDLAEPLSSVTSWALWHVAGDAPALAAVRREADAATGCARHELPFTYAALAETMRLHPPFRRLGRTASADCSFRGRAVAAGDLIWISPYIVHHDERWWPDAESFAPARWLDGSRAQRPRLAFVPFGAGGRTCPGKDVAWSVMAVVLGAVAARRDVEAASPPPAATDLRPNGLRVFLRERRDPYTEGKREGGTT